MNWKRVYIEFITDRLATPREGAVELHHIVPKSQGGDPECSGNQVWLTWSDHIAMTVLQGKIYGPQVCSAVNLMVGRQTKVRRKLLTRRDKNWLQHATRMKSQGCNWRHTIPIYNPETGGFDNNWPKGEAIPDGWKVGNPARWKAAHAKKDENGKSINAVKRGKAGVANGTHPFVGPARAAKTLRDRALRAQIESLEAKLGLTRADRPDRLQAKNWGQRTRDMKQWRFKLNVMQMQRLLNADEHPLAIAAE